ncbi:hypothetical protein GJ496_000781 [Pomphorhynchus laevis]|nr:hypothetical protein GJ496_000781 [Pomphorhynchus laevis]
MPKTRKLRKRRNSDKDSSEEDDIRTSLDDIKLVQKLRQRHKGLNPEVLAFGFNYNGRSDAYTQSINLRTGGYIDVRKVRARDLENMMQGNFARETNHRAEDIQMQRFIENELKRRKISGNADESEATTENEVTTSKSLTIKPVSQHLFIDSSMHKSEEMLSEQMLSGIPEVDLGIEEKVRNIEETEKLKQKLLSRLKEKKSEDISMVPQNMAVNFVQHRRFTTDLVSPIQHDDLVAEYGAKLATGVARFASQMSPKSVDE